MRGVRISLFLAVMVFSWAGELWARTWYVGGAGADFDEIQAAINAADPGDLILVRPVASYAGFTLDKNLTVRCSNGHFETEWIRIENIPDGTEGMVAGFEMVEHGDMHVQDCAGRLVIEDGRIVQGEWPGTYPRSLLRIENCTLVEATQLEVQAGWAGDSGAEPAIVIRNSRVVVSDLKARGWRGLDGVPGWWDPGRGGSGLSIDKNSHVILARVEIVGGQGGKGKWGDLYSYPGPGADGGTGVLAGRAQVLILGCCGNVIRGGDGGEGGERAYSDSGRGGDGGTGLGGNSVVVSGVELYGGAGGYGQPSGDDGLPYVGTPTFVDPPYPILAMEGDVHPGSRFDVTLWGRAGDHAILLLSGTPGWLGVPDYSGPPLMALPGWWFVAFHAGTVDPGGELTVTLAIDPDPVVQGFPLVGQAALLADDGSFELSNAELRVIAE